MTENEQLKDIWNIQEGAFFKAFPQYEQPDLLYKLKYEVDRIAKLPAWSGKDAIDILIEAKRLIEEQLDSPTDGGRALSMASFDEKMIDARCLIERQLAALRYYLENAFSCDEADCGEATTIENICDGLDRGAAMLSEVYLMTKGE